MYACASTVKASIKTVDFTYNGTSFQEFKIKDIRPKKYLNPQEMPLWGVENVDNKYNIDEISLIWGLVDSQYQGHPNVTTLRQPHLYLHGRPDGLQYALNEMDSQNLPASTFYRDALTIAYSIDAPGSSSTNFPADYTGKSNIAQVCYSFRAH